MKKKILELSMAAMLLVGVFWLAREGAGLMASQTQEGYTVVVDPGHGGCR